MMITLLANAFGWMACVVSLWAYYLLATQKVKPLSVTYLTMQVTNCAGFIINALYYTAYPVAVTEAMLIVISIYGYTKIGKRLSSRRRRGRKPSN